MLCFYGEKQCSGEIVYITHTGLPFWVPCMKVVLVGDTDEPPEQTKHNPTQDKGQSEEQQIVPPSGDEKSLNTELDRTDFNTSTEKLQNYRGIITYYSRPI